MVEFAPEEEPMPHDCKEAGCTVAPDNKALVDFTHVDPETDKKFKVKKGQKLNDVVAKS